MAWAVSLAAFLPRRRDPKRPSPSVPVAQYSWCPLYAYNADSEPLPIWCRHAATAVDPSFVASDPSVPLSQLLTSVIFVFGGTDADGDRLAVSHDLFSIRVILRDDPQVPVSPVQFLDRPAILRGRPQIDCHVQQISSAVEDWQWPPARGGSTLVTLPSGNLWLFGGYGYTDSRGYRISSDPRNPPKYLNDTWEFDIRIFRWKCLSTLSSVDSSPTKPAGRCGHSALLVPDATRPFVVVFGGFCRPQVHHGWGVDGGDPAFERCRYFNDLWKWDVIDRRWIHLTIDPLAELPTRQCASCKLVRRRTLPDCHRQRFSRPTARALHCSAVWRDSFGPWMYVFGGVDDGGEGLGDLWRVQLGASHPRWGRVHGVANCVEENAIGRQWCSSCVVGNEWLIVGGIGTAGCESSLLTFSFSDLIFTKNKLSLPTPLIRSNPTRPPAVLPSLCAHVVTTFKSGMHPESLSTALLIVGGRGDVAASIARRHPPPVALVIPSRERLQALPGRLATLSCYLLDRINSFL